MNLVWYVFIFTRSAAIRRDGGGAVMCYVWIWCWMFERMLRIWMCE